GIAVARRPATIRNADITAGAGDVLNVELVPQSLGKLLRDQPSGDVGHAAGRKRDDDPDGLARVLLCEGRARNDERRAERDEADYLFHVSSSFSFWQIQRFERSPMSVLLRKRPKCCIGAK